MSLSPLTEVAAAPDTPLPVTELTVPFCTPSTATVSAAFFSCGLHKPYAAHGPRGTGFFRFLASTATVPAAFIIPKSGVWTLFCNGFFRLLAVVATADIGTTAVVSAAVDRTMVDDVSAVELTAFDDAGNDDDDDDDDDDEEES